MLRAMCCHRENRESWRYPLLNSSASTAASGSAISFSVQNNQRSADSSYPPSGMAANVFIYISVFLQLRPLARSLKLHDHDGFHLASLEGERIFCNCTSLSYTASEINPGQMEAMDAALTHAVQNLPKLGTVCLAFTAYNLW